MPTIHIEMLSGRTRDQKNDLIREIAETTKRVLAVPEEAVRIILTEVPAEHWGVGSRTMADLRSAPGDQAGAKTEPEGLRPD